jgi:hypothetical protein
VRLERSMTRKFIIRAVLQISRIIRETKTKEYGTSSIHGRYEKCIPNFGRKT